MTISILEPNELDLQEKEDAFDFVEQLKVINKTDAEITASLDEALKKAKPLSRSNGVRERIADIKSGRYSAVPMVHSVLNSLSKPYQPGTVTIFGGPAGASKSLQVLQDFQFLMSRGIKCALYELEEDVTFHLTRTLAQESGNSWLTDPDEVKQRADEADAIAIRYSDFLDRFGRVLYASPEIQPTLEQLAEWVTKQAQNGCRIIGIDPVTAAARTGDVWKADAKFLQSIKSTATDYGCSIILVTHPIKNVTFPDLTQLAGSACYQRFAQTIFWIEHHEPKTSRIRTAVGTDEFEHDKTIYILKARNGKGGGYKVAFQFDRDSLTLRELGLILNK